MMDEANHISERMLVLLQGLLGISDEKVLSELEGIMQQHSDLRHSTEVFSEQQLATIALGEADYLAGNCISAEDFKKKLSNYQL